MYTIPRLRKMWKIQRLAFLFIFLACRASAQRAKRCLPRSRPGAVSGGAAAAGHGSAAERGSLRRAPRRPPLRAGEPPRALTMSLSRGSPLRLSGGPSRWLFPRSRVGTPVTRSALLPATDGLAGSSRAPAAAGAPPRFNVGYLPLSPPFVGCFFSFLFLFFFLFPPFLSSSATWACSPKEGVVQPEGGGGGEERRGRWEEGEPELAGGSPACKEAPSDPPGAESAAPPAGTARGKAAGAPGGLTGGRPRGWPRPAGRHGAVALGPHPALLRAARHRGLGAGGLGGRGGLKF